MDAAVARCLSRRAPANGALPSVRWAASALSMAARKPVRAEGESEEAITACRSARRVRSRLAAVVFESVGAGSAPVAARRVCRCVCWSSTTQASSAVSSTACGAAVLVLSHRSASGALSVQAPAHSAPAAIAGARRPRTKEGIGRGADCGVTVGATGGGNAPSRWFIHRLRGRALEGGVVACPRPVRSLWWRGS